MKTIFDQSARQELIARINSLSADALAQWGKMNLYQMITHCTVWESWIQGKNPYVYKQAFIGKLFGKMALKRMISNEKPFDKNVPTSAQFKVKEKDGDIAMQKQRWIALIESYENYSNPGFIHDFFGKMTQEQIGIMAYKHSDHHLRQFNA